MAEAKNADSHRMPHRESGVGASPQPPTRRAGKNRFYRWVIGTGVLFVAVAALIFSLLQPKKNGDSGTSPVVQPAREDTSFKSLVASLDSANDPEGAVEATIDSSIEVEDGIGTAIDPSGETAVCSDAPIGDPERYSTPLADDEKRVGIPAEFYPSPMVKVESGDSPAIVGGLTSASVTGLTSNSAQVAGRCGTTREKLVAKFGGNTESELAVGRGLVWLAKQQKMDGSWVYDGTYKNELIASTGMALLPFLAAGQTHKVSKEPKDNQYTKNVAAGLSYLLKMQKPDGSFKGAGTLYAHAIGTLALCEAFGMTSDKTLLQKSAQSAINYIVAAQGPNGSWGYQAKSNGDTSIVGWQLQALQSAKLCRDLVVDKKVFEKASKFLDSVSQGKEMATYGYANPRPGTTTTAVALLCRYHVDGWGAQKSGMSAGAEYLNDKLAPEMMIAAGKPTKLFDPYYFYYATQVMRYFEGDTWTKWNAAMRDALIEFQIVDAARPAILGSWDPDRGPHIGIGCGRLGTTCLCLLTLEVYYRHVPLYRRP